jgi:hypothetical protein
MGSDECSLNGVGEKNNVSDRYCFDAVRPSTHLGRTGPDQMIDCVSMLFSCLSVHPTGPDPDRTGSIHRMLQYPQPSCLKLAPATRTRLYQHGSTCACACYSRWAHWAKWRLLLRWHVEFAFGKLAFAVAHNGCGGCGVRFSDCSALSAISSKAVKTSSS